LYEKLYGREITHLHSAYIPHLDLKHVGVHERKHRLYHNSMDVKDGVQNAQQNRSL